MKHATFTLRRARAWWRTGLLLALLSGCGGGVDSGGTGGATVTYANGPINGFGSIIVNGVRFDDSTPSIIDDDGNTLTRTDLKLGMVVEVRGSAITTDASGDPVSAASSIAISSEIVGPIDSLPDLTSFVVLGRNIDVKVTTVFADCAPGGLSDLVASDVVEIYGLYNADLDRFTATRIECKSSPPLHYRVHGKVSGLNTTTTTFSIGSLLINYASAGSVPSGFGNGAVVRVRIDPTVPPAGGAWTANRLRSGVRSPDDGFESKVEGLIDSFTSNTQFSVSGVPVTTDGQTVFDLSGGPLDLGVRVEVEGRFSSGTLAATKVEVELDSGDDFDFRGAIASVTSSTLTMHGVAISHDGNTKFINGNAADLRAGVTVRVKADLINGTQLQATRIEFRN